MSATKREVMEVPAGGRYCVKECGCELVASDETDIAAASSGGERSLTVAVGRPKCKQTAFVTHWGIYPPNCTYLGSGTSSPVPAVRECACNGVCGTEAHECGICGKHCPGKPAAHPPAEPPPPKYKPAVIEDSVDYGSAVGPLVESTHPTKPQGAPASCYLERWDGQTHQPLTALEAIRARPKPEPWVPSCDELHWLPDA